LDPFIFICCNYILAIGAGRSIFLLSLPTHALLSYSSSPSMASSGSSSGKRGAESITKADDDVKQAGRRFVLLPAWVVIVETAYVLISPDLPPFVLLLLHPHNNDPTYILKTTKRRHQPPPPVLVVDCLVPVVDSPPGRPIQLWKSLMPVLVSTNDCTHKI
jgi:hypothetical protein